MATFKITPANSVYAIAPGDDAFDSNPAGSDTLVLDANAFLTAVGFNANAVTLGGPDAWTATINGSVFSLQYGGIVVGGASRATINVGAEGSVAGVTGIQTSAPGTIRNAGVITGTNDAISVPSGGAHTIANSGLISGALHSIFDYNGLSTDKVTNSGSLVGNVDLSGGDDSLTNSGFIFGDLLLGSGNNTLVNSGSIVGGVLGVHKFRRHQIRQSHRRHHARRWQ
jgi:hypothetical protein